MATQDIRWQQRLQNYRKVLSQLDDAMALMARRELSKLEKQASSSSLGLDHHPLLDHIDRVDKVLFSK